MTDQEAFDKMVAHLSSLSERIFDKPSDKCVYIRSDGQRCVVGALCTEEEAKNLNSQDPDIEDLFYDKEEPESLSGLNPRMLTDMQFYHDSPTNWDSKGFLAWDKIRRVAKEYKLNADGIPKQ